ncbi:MAG: ornithine carbamoyltransferase [Rhodobacteraceae bacterium]|nr:MAG: ornithine carbamoyltransferase [Paracoccaceae bacterium]
MPHFLDIADTPAADLRAMIEASKAMKAARAGRPKGTADDDRPLAGRMLAMIFEKPSTRTRVSFDMAMRQLGGETMLLNGADMQLGRGETLADTARVLSRYVDAIMIRTTAHAKLLELAEHATVPVINALTDDSHPCQIMADVMTVEERRGPIAGRKLAWCGDGNNMAQTFVEAATQFDFALALACPEALDVAPRFLDRARAAGARVTVERDPAKAVAGADAVITDTWLSMGDEGAARERRHNLLRPYQVDAALMRKAKPDALFLHCLPAHREEEATAEVMDGPQSVIFDEAENRLHAQKGVLRWCLGAL